MWESVSLVWLPAFLHFQLVFLSRPSDRFRCHYHFLTAVTSSRYSRKSSGETRARGGIPPCSLSWVQIPIPFRHPTFSNVASNPCHSSRTGLKSVYLPPTMLIRSRLVLGPSFKMLGHVTILLRSGATSRHAGVNCVTFPLPRSKALLFTSWQFPHLPVLSFLGSFTRSHS